MNRSAIPPAHRLPPCEEQWLELASGFSWATWPLFSSQCALFHNHQLEPLRRLPSGHVTTIGTSPAPLTRSTGPALPVLGEIPVRRGRSE